MRKKTLKGIVPFNDCWFRTCYYHQLMAGMSYFGVPAEYTVFNFTTEILFGKEKGDYTYRSKDVLGEEEFAELTGVQTEKHRVEDVISFVKKSIGRNRPVILGQDNYYLEYRPEYRQWHDLHFVLAFGYDDGAKTLTVMEHSFASGLDFRPRRASFDSVAEAHKGFCENCAKFSWSAIELKESENKAAFARKLELVNKMCEPLRKLELGDYLKLYGILRDADVKDSESTMETSLYLARYLRARMLQYEKYCGIKEILTPLEKVWRCAHFMQGVAMKANHVKSVEIYKTQAVEDKLRVMKEEAEKFERAVASL